MDISIIGASGACGREIAIQVIRDRLLERREILQLVGSNPASRHPFALHGFRADHPPVVVVVTNPVELGVHLFAEHLPPVEGYWREETDLLYDAAQGIQRKLAAWCA